MKLSEMPNPAVVGRSDYLVDLYSERKDSTAEFRKRIDQRAI